jgi:hypothetical protein
MQYFPQVSVYISISIFSEIHGRLVGTFGPGPKDPGFKSRFTSAARLAYQWPSGVWIACDDTFGWHGKDQAPVTSEVTGSNPGRADSSSDKGDSL